MPGWNFAPALAESESVYLRMLEDIFLLGTVDMVMDLAAVLVRKSIFYTAA